MKFANIEAAMAEARRLVDSAWDASVAKIRDAHPGWSADQLAQFEASMEAYYTEYLASCEQKFADAEAWLRRGGRTVH